MRLRCLRQWLPLHQHPGGGECGRPGDTIRLCSGTYRESATIIVNKDLTFVGAGDGEGGTVVDGQAVRAVISIRTSGPVIMRHLRISGGLLLGGEGAGLNNSGTTTLEHCTVTDNHVLYGGSERANGGGIYNSGDLTLTDCTVSGNEAGGYGGGIYNFGTLVLTGCSVSGNTATIGAGVLNDGTLTANDSIVNDNTAQWGGGIYNFYTLTMNGTTVSGNTAEKGGGIYNRNWVETTQITLNQGASVISNLATGFDGVFGGGSIIGQR